MVYWGYIYYVLKCSEGFESREEEKMEKCNFFIKKG